MYHVKNLSHPTTIERIRAAAENVLRRGFSVDHVLNSKGAAFLAVRMTERGLEIRDGSGAVVNDTVLAAVRLARKGGFVA